MKQYTKNYCTKLNGASFLQLQRKPSPDFFRAVALNDMLMCLAGTIDRDGALVYPSGAGYTIEDLAAVLRLQRGDVLAAVNDLTEAGILATEDGIIRFANWNVYQGANPPAVTESDKRAAAADRQRKSRAKKAEAGEAEKLFNEWWEIYPRHEARQPALKAWMKLATAKGDERVDLQSVIEATETLIATPSYSPFHTEKKFTPLAATWLNGRRFEDVISA